MTPPQEHLRAFYAERSDTALLGLAAERDTLTPEALSILLEELQQRALPLPPLAHSELDLPPTASWVTVDRFRDLSSAIVARGALESAGIPCFLRDENTVRMDWQISNFIGGMRLQVPAEHQDLAQHVLQQIASADHAAHEVAPEDRAYIETGEHCPFCGSADVHRVEPGLGLRLAALLLFTLPLPRGKRSWQCLHCGRQFPESDLVPSQLP